MNPGWDERIQGLTHILTHPTTTPSLHSQLFISSKFPPSFLHHHHIDYYPPILSSHLLRFSFSLFLRRIRHRPLSSWRSKCPFQQPPPLVLSSAVEPAPEQWGPEERRGYFRRRLRRRKLGLRVPTLVAVIGPNLAVLMMLFLDPMWWNRPQSGEG